MFVLWYSIQKYSNMLLMGRCGHVGCKQCCDAGKGAIKGPDQCPDEHGGSVTLPSSSAESSDMTIALSSGLRHQHGSKMVAISDLIEDIPETDKVLLFVQFGRVATALVNTLRERGINFADTTVARTAASNVANFTRSPNCKVCVLEVDSPNAARW